MKRININEVQNFAISKAFGKPVLITSSRIDPHTVPDNVFLYEIDDNDPREMVLCERAGCFQYSVISASKIALYGQYKCRRVPKNCDLITDYATVTLEDYCKAQNVSLSRPYCHISIREPKLPDEEKMFYAFCEHDMDDPVIKARIGHVRIDFGDGGDRLWHSWWEQNGNEDLNTLEFKSDLAKVVDNLRRCVLKDMSSMRSYCYSNGTPLPGSRDYYGFVVETEEYVYYLRTTYIQGDYNAYLNCFKKSLLPEV